MPSSCPDSLGTLGRSTWLLQTCRKDLEGREVAQGTKDSLRAVLKLACLADKIGQMVMGV